LDDVVLLSDSDNELYLNLKNLDCIKVLLDLVKNRPSFNLVEFLFDDKNALAKGPDGSFTNEFVVSFYKDHEMLQAMKNEEKNN